MAGRHLFPIESHGVRIDVLCPSDQTQAVETILPPGHTEADARETAEAQLELTQSASGAYGVAADGMPLLESSNRDIALGTLDAQIRAFIALHAPDRIFVHAGVVAIDSVALLLPGSSFAGKTTLVAALVQRGATYFSDEFAVLDEAGLVHPYPKPLSIRADGSPDSTETPASALGAAIGDGATRVGLIAITSYRPATVFNPVELTRGAAALALLEHTVPARTRSTQSLAFLSRAAAGARAVQGERGDADAAADALIGLLA